MAAGVKVGSGEQSDKWFCEEEDHEEIDKCRQTERESESSNISNSEEIEERGGD